MVDAQPAVRGLNRNAVAAHAGGVPPVVGARAVDGGHGLLRPGAQVLGLRQPDVRPAAMKGDVAPVDAPRKEHVVLVVLAHDERADALPADQVVAAGDHGQDAAAQVRGRPRTLEFTAIGGVGHVERAVDLDHTWVLHPARIAAVVGFEHGAAQPVPGEAVAADGVADAADPVQPLSAVVHVKQPVVVDHRRVEDVVAFPIREGVGQQEGIGRVALQAKCHGRAYPLIPVNVMPSINWRWARKKIRRMGRAISVDIAISQCHLGASLAPPTKKNMPSVRVYLGRSFR